MSTIGSPIESSLLQAAQAQQVASKKRDRERAGEAESGRRLRDLVDLRVAGVEQAEAPRAIPENDSEQAETEHRAETHERAKDNHDRQPRSIDLTA